MPWRGPIPGRAFAPVIVFIPCSGDGGKPGEYDGEWLPRQCPGCGQFDVIGPGRRRRQAHDRAHDWIRVRRGFCNRCHRTLTALPGWCVPLGRYSLAARREAIGSLAAGQSLEQAAPECRDPDRVAAAATIRRWAWRRLDSLRGGAALAWNLFSASPLLAGSRPALVEQLFHRQAA